ncbi:VWA domain-containing protein [Candidatus Woesearchaeota archaeon]|nr:VWA domain-containing protein [Candidatus Woesearchaeota archaeon]
MIHETITGMWESVVSSIPSLEMISQYTHLKYPYVLLLFIILIIAVIILIRKNFITFKDNDEKKQYLRKKRWLRIFVMFTRFIILACIFIAIATPFTFEEKIVTGDLSIMLMADNSTSFELYDKSLAGTLKEQLEMSFPAQLKYLAVGDRSALGDGLLSGLKGDDNILLVTDGQNNQGKSLRDVALFLANLNATINALYLDPVHDDTNIVIRGLDKAVRGTELTFVARVTQVGQEKPYHVKITMGNKVMVDENGVGSQTFRFSRKMGEGYHKIEGEVTLLEEGEDHFPENNMYYRTIEILERPKIFMWSQKESYFYDFMIDLFHFAREDNLAGAEELNDHVAVMMNDLSINDITGADYERLVDFVLNGSGLIVYGGKNAYDLGGYRNSLFETILPVNTKSADPEEARKEKINVILLLDISDSTGGYFNAEGDLKVDVEKSLAISVLDFIKEDSQVGVVAFNADAYVVAPLTPLSARYDIEERISRLRDGGGTDIEAGINKAAEVFSGVSGSNSIILISDGVTSSPSGALAAAERAKRQGINIFTVGVGGDTDELTLKNIASITGGHYYRPTQSQRLKIIFGEPEEDDMCNEDRKKAVIMEPNHFITDGLEVNAVLTGHNHVAPKSTATVLLATCDGKPIITAWRYGLGRVVSVSTDDGSGWSGELLNAENSEIITRMINWAIGDPTRNRDFDVDVNDGNIGDPIRVVVKSKDRPESDLVQFKQIDELHYEGYFSPSEPGFYDFFGSVAAVNYKKELEKIGFNNDLIGLVKATGGEMFEPEDLQGMINKTKSVSKRTESVENTLRWPLLAIAMLVFLLEIAVRRITEMW